jgi:hypothetical protein
MGEPKGSDGVALSLRQPWAALVASGRKTVEIRRWATARRGRVWIHAARSPDERAAAWQKVPAGLEDLTRLRGGIVGVAELVGCVAYRRAEDFAADAELHLNDAAWFAPPMYGFRFCDARPVAFRACAGQTRFFGVDGVQLA